MSAVLVLAIGVLVVVGLAMAARVRRGGGADPASSVDAFHRALTAMEPGASARGDGDRDAGHGGADAHHLDDEPHRSR